MARTKKINIIGPAIFLLLIVGGCAKLVEAVFGSGDPVKAAQAAQAARPSAPIPNLVNGTLLDAENKTEELGLQLVPDGNSYCSASADCVIYRMSPKPGTMLKAGAKVAVKFVTAEELAWYRKHRTMPNVVGWTEDKADQFFKPVSDAVDSSNKESSKVPVGKDMVLAQFPKPGRPVKMGQKIKLVIGYNYGTSSGTGDGNINVPNTRGESRFCSRRWWC